MAHDAPPSPLDPIEAARALARRGARLEVSTVELCFLTLLRGKAAEAALPSFSEGQLIDAFERACALVEPGADSVRARATHAIRRLREQQLLSRVDLSGVRRPGELTLTPLASVIVASLTEEELLTRESLTLLADALQATLRDIAAAARRATDAEAWRQGVVAPLRVTVTELLDGIERRQRGLDLRQEAFQREIGELLQADWFGAVSQCESLLEASAATLRELHEVLLRSGHRLQGLLQDLQDAVEASETAHGVETEIARVSEHVDRIAAWGEARQLAWSEYYDHVQGYLRDVVRLDPSRALAARLRSMLAGELGRSYALTVARSSPLRVLREMATVEPPPPPRKPRKQRDRPLDDDPAAPDPRDVLRERVASLLDEGVHELSDVTERLVADLPDGEAFLVAGRVAQVFATLRRPHRARDRPWVPVKAGLVIEQLEVPPEKVG